MTFKTGMRVVYAGDHPITASLLVGVGIVLEVSEGTATVDWINAPGVSAGIHELRNLAPALSLVG